MSDRLLQHCARDALWSCRCKCERKRAADAISKQVAPLDLQVIEQPELILGVHVPAVAPTNRSRRMPRVSLIHRDQTKLGCELDRRVVRRGFPELDVRTHATRCEQKHWKPLP